MKTFHTLIQLFFASAGSRLFIANFFSILRHLLVHAAGDVADAAIRVHDMAADIEDRLKAQSLPTKVGLDDLHAAVNSFVDEAKDRSEEVPTRCVASKISGRTLVETRLIRLNMTLLATSS